MPISDDCRARILRYLEQLYAGQADEVTDRIESLADRFLASYLERRDSVCDRPEASLWDERTMAMITYGDQVSSGSRPALDVQRQFLIDFEFDGLLSAIHVLPFFPYTSDDGFSIVDYRRVAHALGDWEDIRRLGESFDLMFDFVINHCSQQHAWFQAFLRDESPYTGYFITVDPSTDLSAVTRPRSSPVLTPFATPSDIKHAWTTFSADQIDWNFASPDVLVEMLDVLFFYILCGASILRLDAIGFLWKRIGTSCMHLPETHAVVKLIRTLLDELAPGTLLITETNVPHRENISYFGDGDEAHVVYQFSLPPLLLDAFLTGDARPLVDWLTALEPPGRNCTFFNFTASHDGIGVRPLEGLVPTERIEALVRRVEARGGLVSMRQNRDGTESPYELNTTYFSALGSPNGLAPDLHARKFLASQGFMLALQGIPGIYFHSLVATPNDRQGVEQTGHYRAINRRKYGDDELRALLHEESGMPRTVLDGYRTMLDVRRQQAAFHPDAPQQPIPIDHASLIVLTRTSLDGRQTVLVVVNVGDTPATVDLTVVPQARFDHDLITGRQVEGQHWTIEPFGIAWLTTG